MGKNPVLYIVIPCYNEETVLPVTAPMFLAKIEQLVQDGKISTESRILFVNDGSMDSTWAIITALHKENRRYMGISLSRNCGHQYALLAGLFEAKKYCDITISIDCDGQDDLDAMDEMVNEYLDGCEVVYGVRSDRTSDTWFKRVSAQSFYSLMRSLGAHTVYNHADYRLASEKVISALEQYREQNVYLRGIFPLVGFKSTSVYYSRKERLAGESHYPLRKMLSLAMSGVTSFSIKPLHIITGIGLVVSLLGTLGIIWAIIEVVLGNTVAGWASIVCIMCFLGGIQLICLGVIGEYVGKTYMETKQRPRYIIAERALEPEGIQEE